MLIMGGCADDTVSTECVGEIIDIENDVVIPKAYDVILKDIYDALQSEEPLYDVENEYFSLGIMEEVMSISSAEDRLKAIAYCIMDINKDGVEELLIVVPNHAKSGCVIILDMYTIIEEMPVKVTEGWSRNRVYLLEDGVIYIVSSGGACYTNLELLSLEPGTDRLTTKELYFTYPKGDNMTECGYYYSENGVYDVASAVEISGAEFEEFFDACNSINVEFEATTFDGYNAN